jgi:hypothetical protein
MNKKIQNIGIGAASDILSAVDFGATGFVASLGNAVISKLFKDRAEKARDIALREMARCDRLKFDIPEADEFVAIVYRYGRAALEGTAKLNLRIMAKIMRGQATEGSLYASEFNEFADIISSLKPKEVVYLGTMLKLYSEGVCVPKEDCDEMYDLEQSVAIQMQKQLNGSTHFPDHRDFSVCQAGLQRTSLIYPATHLINGFTIYAPARDLERLKELVEFSELVDGNDIIED